MKDTLLVRCLDITRPGTPFTLNSQLVSGFSYSLDTMEERTPPPRPRNTIKRKETSPSTKKRNARRMEDFLQRKRSSSSSTPDPPSSLTPTPDPPTAAETFPCDECDYTAKTERGLMTHKRQQHRIPQTDGGNPEVSEDEVDPKKAMRKMVKELKRTAKEDKEDN